MDPTQLIFVDYQTNRNPKNFNLALMLFIPLFDAKLEMKKKKKSHVAMQLLEIVHDHNSNIILSFIDKIKYLYVNSYPSVDF